MTDTVNSELQSITTDNTLPFQDINSTVDVEVALCEEPLKKIKDTPHMTAADFFKVATVQAIISACSKQLPTYVDDVNRMKLGKDTWKNRLQNIKAPNAATISEFSRAFSVWKTTSVQTGLDEENEEEDLSVDPDDKLL